MRRNWFLAGLMLLGFGVLSRFLPFIAALCPSYDDSAFPECHHGRELEHPGWFYGTVFGGACGLFWRRGVQHAGAAAKLQDRAVAGLLGRKSLLPSSSL